MAISTQLLRIARWEIPNYTRFGLYSQALIIVGCYFCFQWWPVIPTVALGFLSVVAVIMTVRADRFSHGERVVYVLIAFVLFGVEMRAIYADRDKHDKEEAEARRLQLDGFRQIGDGLTDAIRKSDEHFTATMGRTNEVIRNITGGTSYPYFQPHMLATTMDGMIQIEGKYPVQELVVIVDDVTEMVEGENLSNETIRALSKDEIAPFRVPFKYATGFSFPFISPGTYMPTPSPIPFSGKGERHLYHVTFNARNGRWAERILLKKDKYHYRWRIAYQVFKGDFMADKSLIKTWVEPVFPLLDNGKPDLR